MRNALIIALAMLATPLVTAESWTLATFEKGVFTEASKQNLYFYSDKEESPKSSSQIVGHKIEDGQTGAALRIAYKVPENPSLGYSYAGASIQMLGKGISPYNALTFYFRWADGPVPNIYVNIKNKQNDRDQVYIRDYIQPPHPGVWNPVTIPLADFKKMKTEAMLASIDGISFGMDTGENGKFDIDEVILKGERKIFAKAALVIPPRAKYPWKDGHAVWCYHDKDYNIDQIQTYNKTAPDGKKIVYVFPWASSFEFHGEGKSQFWWEPEDALYYAEKLGPDVEIMPIIDASVRGFEELTSDEIDDLARKAGEAVNKYPQFKGLQIDIEPHNSAVHELFVRLRKYTKKPITIAVSRWSPETFQAVDAVAYMMYDITDDARMYMRQTNKSLFKWLEDARSVDGKFWIGVPALATHAEYEYKIEKDGGKRTESGYKMTDYMNSAFKVMKKHLKANERGYIGLGVWGLVGGEGMSSSKGSHVYYPGEIKPDIWKYFQQDVN